VFLTTGGGDDAGKKAAARLPRQAAAPGEARPIGAAAVGPGRRVGRATRLAATPAAAGSPFSPAPGHGQAHK